MSDRIKELARKAGLIAPYGSDREGLAEFDYRQFAELIVRECAIIAETEDSYYGTWMGRVIKEHFGVKS